MKTISLQSPAKINPYLKILNKRPDGFHNILGLFVAIDLFDTLTFTIGDEISMTCSGDPSMPVDSSNLIIKAANLLIKEYNVKRGVKIHLEKNIPSGAGLGGGSGNAAITLLALNRLWELNCTGTALRKLGLSLGSDVPFFMSGTQAAIGEGRGEILSSLPPFPPFWLVVVYPTVSISTRWAYREAKNILTENGQNFNLRGLYFGYLQKEMPLSSFVTNDFEEVVRTKYPEISKVKQKLLNDNADAAVMTGSGSAVIGFFKEKSRAAQWIAENKDLRTFLAQPLKMESQTFANLITQEESREYIRG